MLYLIYLQDEDGVLLAISRTVLYPSTSPAWSSFSGSCPRSTARGDALRRKERRCDILGNGGELEGAVIGGRCCSWGEGQSCACWSSVREMVQALTCAGDNGIACEFRSICEHDFVLEDLNRVVRTIGCSAWCFIWLRSSLVLRLRTSGF